VQAAAGHPHHPWDSMEGIWLGEDGSAGPSCQDRKGYGICSDLNPLPVLALEETLMPSNIPPSACCAAGHHLQAGGSCPP